MPAPAVKGYAKGTLSPHVLGWPVHRPRLYLKMTLDSSCHLPHGCDGLHALYRKPKLDVWSLLVAPKVELDEARWTAAVKKCVSKTSGFDACLSAGKSAYLSLYRQHARVEKILSQGPNLFHAKLHVMFKLLLCVICFVCR